ncbi:MAG: efflux transporter periplasmic adaptor subunit [Lentisphaeria bacterium]|nr:efflux transporter periplasmic adaptor subunit [Lentisphaeria bacterium]
MRRIKKLLAFLPVVVAVAVVIVLLRTRTRPAAGPADEAVRSLRVLDAPVVAFRPRAMGYGLAEPTRVWQAVAEVRGTVVKVHPQLKAGALVRAETVLLEIDRADYELAAARLRASMAETGAKIDELDAEERSRQAAREIERRSLDLARKSLERTRELGAAKIVPADQVDREERDVLRQEQAIQQHESALALIPSRRQALEAGLAVLQADLDQATVNVGRTVIRAPFDCRLGTVNIARGQFLTAGQPLFEAHGTEAVEVEARFRPEQMRNLLAPEKRRSFQPGMTMEGLQELFELEVNIRLRSGAWEATWPARFDRIRETVDPRTRAINVVAVVENPYEQIIPGVRPALMRGMVCEVLLQAPPRPGTVVLPRAAVRDNRVFLVDADGRLRSATVALALAQDDFVVVETGLQGGERVVMSDPTPAIEGMRIQAFADRDAQRRLVDQAEGRENPP